ncbi:MAG: hypothetical protein ABI623_01910 [bacterium]
MTSGSSGSVKDAMRNIRQIVFHPDAHPVVRTVANNLSLMSGARQIPAGTNESPGTFHVEIDGNTNASVHGESWIECSIDATGKGYLHASQPHWLYAGHLLLESEWSNADVTQFAGGVRISPTFPRMRNLSDFFVGSLRHARNFQKEDYVRQVARHGFSHLTINGLGTHLPFESGPPGDVYSWFYDYSPDLDQFVDSFLVRGFYPPDYLQVNLNNLKAHAALARKYGLTPGLHINSPRSMPEEFWSKYPYLRGARVDHPRETFRPRYTLAMAHPVVQAHYRELVRNIMAEVPELGFIHLWTNDSGAGFEFVSSLYAGRNGGPYLIREWKDDDEIARKAASNVLSYYRLLAGEAKKVNPDFRLVCDLGPFYAERKYIVPELGNGIDAGEFGYFESKEAESEKEILAQVGAATHVKLDVSDLNIPGVPYPWLVYERLMNARDHGTDALLLNVPPNSLAPYDVNNEVIRSVQLGLGNSVEEIIGNIAKRFVGNVDALIEIWRLSDSAVRAFPSGVPMSTFGFPWFRLWVRPFVPNIDAIPEKERAYYERFLLATFNNPARVDLNNDMMWNFLSVDEAAAKKSTFDTAVIPPLTSGIELCENAIQTSSRTGIEIFTDLRDRLRAYRCFCTTMRNTIAWTESVHGFMRAASGEMRERYRLLCRSMVENEIENARALLGLWKEDGTEVIPISSAGETLHIYGENFGELVQKKILLMEAHKNDEPFIDPDYMWRMQPSITTN